MLRLLAVIYAFALVPLCSAAEGTWHHDIDLALEEAQKEGKSVLLFFTGSDWCEPCQTLKAEVLNQPAFLSTGQKTFVLAEIDFPEKSSQPTEIALKNQRLAERYHIEGYPTIVLVSADGRPFWIEIGAVKENPARYVRELTYRHKRYQKFLQCIKDSKGLLPPAAAQKISDGLERLPDELVPRHYRAELEQLTKLDPKDNTGYRKRLQFADERAKINAEMTRLFFNGDYALLVKKIDKVIENKSDIFSKTNLQMLHLRCSMANLHLKDFDAAMEQINLIEKIGPDTRIGKHVKKYRGHIKHCRQAFHKQTKAAEKAEKDER